MTVSPMSSREGSGGSRRETPRRGTVRYRPVFSRPAGDYRAVRSLLAQNRVGNAAWQPVEPTGHAEGSAISDRMAIPLCAYSFVVGAGNAAA